MKVNFEVRNKQIFFDEVFMYIFGFVLLYEILLENWVKISGSAVKSGWITVLHGFIPQQSTP